MPVEIEAKLKVETLSVVRDRLKARGATRQGEVFEVNMFFDTDDRSLLAADEGLRLRSAKPTDGGPEKFTITFKGPRQQGAFKSREEIEIGVTESAATVELFERLGYSRVLSFEKKRETWKLGGCSVELDEIPFLGFFVEIEGRDEAAVTRVREELGLSDRNIVKASYIALLTGYLQERGHSQRVIQFTKVAK